MRFDEWFRNGPLGLQHGFDIAALPAEAHDLQVTVDVGEGWATSSTSGDANGAIDLHRADGRGERYSYSYLRAWDASGRFLPAKLTALDRGLRIAVDVRDAALPITIDPLLQLAILVPGDPTPGSLVGISVAVRGNRALVGAPHTSIGGNTWQGVVYMYQRNTTTGVWALRRPSPTLTASSGTIRPQRGLGGLSERRDWWLRQGLPPVYQRGRQYVGQPIEAQTGTRQFLRASVAAEGSTIVAGAPGTSCPGNRRGVGLRSRE